jgi:hypothetical protein
MEGDIQGGREGDTDIEGERGLDRERDWEREREHKNPHSICIILAQHSCPCGTTYAPSSHTLGISKHVRARS